jgi:hypothetical protein
VSAQSHRALGGTGGRIISAGWDSVPRIEMDDLTGGEPNRNLSAGPLHVPDISGAPSKRIIVVAKQVEPHAQQVTLLCDLSPSSIC